MTADDDDRFLRRDDRGLARVLVEFAHTLGTDFSIQRILDYLVGRIVELLPVDGAGVMLMGRAQRLHFIAASDEKILVLQGLQNELGQGPCLAAYATGEAVAVTDLAGDVRFPTFSPRAAAAGLGAVFTFPMRLDENRLGALDLYRSRPGALNSHDLRGAQVLADVAAAYIFNAQARVDTSAAAAHLNRGSLHDPLTGLPNRTLLHELLEQTVARARRSHRMAAVLFVDLDGFKQVNDEYGHHVGDQLLVAVAQRLSETVRPGDVVTRLGGDEFVVLCEDVTSAADGDHLAARITAALAETVLVAENRLSVTASVGIAFSGPAEDLPETLLRDADYAMVEAKQNGGARHRRADRAARQAADHRHDLERDLRTAIATDQLHLAYQPIVAIPSRRLAGIEALLRWEHPRRGPISPAAIISIAERTGDITALGHWVLRQACRDAASWRQQRHLVPAISVNVSAHQIMGAAFADTVRGVMRETATDPHTLCLEITETALLADAARATAVLTEITDTGVSIALDDFGTGYSSLNYLRHFPFHSVKIDRSFIADIARDDATRAIVSAVINLSHVLDLVVVAEGIETAPQLADLSRLGADRAQGFLLSRPMVADELLHHLPQHGPAHAPGGTRDPGSPHPER
jgi:diguanylate cyclase (GGDEF)-like protein